MIGMRLAHWIVEKELGRGGMGAVYLARRAADADDKVPEQAAIKVLVPELAVESSFLFRFQREVEALRQLNHPNVVRFHEAGQQDRLYFYAMEYVSGRNFDEILQEKGRLPWKEVLDMALQVTPALKHAHDHGIIHRDLKPHNLMRTDDGIVKLADFGVAKVFASRQLTATGGLVGTAEYVSPEQAAGKPVTIRSDLYSFGVVLYALITGRLPFQGKNILDFLHQHRYGQFDAPKRYVPDLPVELDDVICCLMAKEASERPPNALALLRTLEGIRGKLQRKDQLTVDGVQVEATRADDKGAPEKFEPAPMPGPATLMGGLMRWELANLQRGGPLNRFFNHPLVLVCLAIGCLAVLGWRFWPDSASSLYNRGERLMQSADPLDWDRAETECFEPLDRKFPEHPYGDAVKEFRQRHEESQAERRPLAASRTSFPSEAQRFYQIGQRQRKDGNLIAAAGTFRNLVTAFDGVAGEEKWVRLAEKALSDVAARAPPAAERLKPVHETLKRTEKMKREEAEKIWTALEELYRHDPSAQDVLKRIDALRSAKTASKED